MKNFDNFGDFSEHLLAVSGTTKEALHKAVEKAAKMVEGTAVASIGIYQDAVGTMRGNIGVFPAWAELAESTERQKEAMGYPLDSPLLASGEFRDTITREVKGLDAVVATSDERGVWFEEGTPHMPPRPVFGPAAVRNEDKVLRLFVEAVASVLAGGGLFHPLSGDGDA